MTAGLRIEDERELLGVGGFRHNGFWFANALTRDRRIGKGIQNVRNGNASYRIASNNVRLIALKKLYF